mgnify:CR=1 FL=1
MPEELYDIETTIPSNPIEEFLRMDRMPHIWCPGCGIGTTVNCFVRALQTSGLDLDKVAVVSSSHDMVGFIIEDKPTADALRGIHQALWKALPDYRG